MNAMTGFRPSLLPVVSLAVLSSCGGSDTAAPPTPTVASIQVTPDQATAAAIGMTLQFTAVARDESGSAISTALNWSSHDTGVATVTSSGLVTTVGNGTSEIRATSRSVTGSATLTVHQEIDEITVSVTELVLDRWGDTARVVVEAVDAAGTPVEGTQVAWASSDENVVAVDDTGLATSWQSGAATLTWNVTLPAGQAASGRAPGLSQEHASEQEGTVQVDVAVQRNPECTVPTEFPHRPPVGPMPTWVFSDVPFAAVPEWLANYETANGDFDGDGDDDLIAMQYMDVPPNGIGTTKFWRNVNGVFEDATEAVLGPDPIPEGLTTIDAAQVVDFNGDGVVDIFKTQSGYDDPPYPGAKNVFLLSQGDGTLRDVSGTHVIPNEQDFSHDSSAGDVDCDGDQDLIVVNHSSSTIPGESNHLYINNGSGMLVAEDDRLPDWLARNRPVQRTDFCDLDRDGDLDLVAVSGEDYEDDLILVNDGFGRFRAAPASLPPRPLGLPSSRSVACTDLDLDGWPDLVVSHTAQPKGSETDYDSRLSVWMNRGDLTFEEVVLFDQQQSNNVLARVVDINGDGWIDLLRADAGPSSETTLLLNNGGTSFVPGPMPVGGSGIVDADGDGRLDAFRPASADLGEALFWYQR